MEDQTWPKPNRPWSLCYDLLRPVVVVAPPFFAAPADARLVARSDPRDASLTYVMLSTQLAEDCADARVRLGWSAVLMTRRRE